ncbi:MAG: hypothetical protein RMJ51_03955 [Candidatus Calescibacterium sp.]|nr:hypothetical protein [Candidatus Calescibacterium sp.]MCX7971772.1 hypothetical protein [bacterium]MDW8195378.1 hypothetical protein [Candidatus Calescibacterium sp.]
MRIFRIGLFLLILMILHALLIGFKVTGKVSFMYQDNIKSYINNNPDSTVTFYYNLTCDNKHNNYYDCSFELKGLVSDQIRVKPELMEIVRMITRGFRVNFGIDENLNFVYLPDVEYFYSSDPVYKKYQDRIDENTFKDFSKSLFYNFYDWFGKLKKRGYIDMIKFGFYVDYNVFYESASSNLYLPIGRERYRAKFLNLKANISNIYSNTDFFNGMRMVEGYINSYEYYEHDTYVPLLFQRELIMRFEILDPIAKQQYFEKYKRYDVEYKILKTMVLLYKN